MVNLFTNSNLDMPESDFAKHDSVRGPTDQASRLPQLEVVSDWGS